MQKYYPKKRMLNKLKTGLLLLVMVLFAGAATAQTLPDPFNMTRGTYTVQNSKVYKFYDSGGPDLYTPEEDPNNDYNWVTWYQPNEDITVTLLPGTSGYGIEVDFSFTGAYLNINNDFLSFYDGSQATDANLIATYSCNDYFVSSPGITGFKVQSHGAMTIVFSSDGRYNAEGWNAQISLVQNYTPQPPVVLRSKCGNTIQLFPTTKGENTSQYFYTLPNGSEQEYTLGASIDVDSYTFPLSVSARSKIDGDYSSSKSYSIASKVQAYDPPTYVHNPGNNTVTPWFIAKPESLRDTYYIRYYIGNNPGTDPNTWPSNQEFRQPDYTYEPVAAGDIDYSDYVPPFTVAMALRGTTCNTLFSTIVSVTISEIAVVKPTITFGTGNTTTATLDCDMTAPQGKSIRMFYTTDGSTPTMNSSLYEGAISNITAGTTVKAIAVMMEQNEGQWVQSPGYGISAVASEMYLPGGEGQSGVYGDIVLLDDREPHTWSYYSDGDQPVHSLKPADVKITYFGNGSGKMVNEVLVGGNMTTTDISDEPTTFGANATNVAVGPDAPENQFIYLKTLENANEDGSGNYPYTMIPNPFSKRPTGQDNGSQTVTPETRVIYLVTTGNNNGRGTLTVTYTNAAGQENQRETVDINSNNYNNTRSITVKAGTSVTVALTRTAGTVTTVGRYDANNGTQVWNFNRNNNGTTTNSYDVNAGASYDVSFGIYRGFYAWRVKRLSSGLTIKSKDGNTTYGVNAIIPAETEIEFITTNAKGNEVDFEAMWAQACVSDGNTTNLHPAYSYERNFVINAAPDANLTVPVTYSSYKPDGTAANTISVNGFTCSADTKFEYMTISGGTFTANNHDLIMGRGLTGTATTLQGISGGFTGDLDYTLRVESGTYTTMSFVRDHNNNGSHIQVTGTVHVKAILGSDYDRAIENGDNKLHVSSNGTFYFSRDVEYHDSRNKDVETFNCVIKSGSYQEHQWNGTSGDSNYNLYCGPNHGGNNTYPGIRNITIEGGKLANMNAGQGTGDTSTNNQTNHASTDVVNFNARIKGGTFYGCVFGGASDNPSNGSKRIVVTGGTINGWIAGGANGFGNVSGTTSQTNGNSYIYVGGNSTIGSTTPPTINGTPGGNVFGAGRGKTDQRASIDISNVVVADNSTVYQNVYGAGYCGYITNTANVYVLGGTVKQNVFGGGYDHNGTVGGVAKIIPATNIYIKGGVVQGSVYGGSNTSGTVGTDDDNKAMVNVSGGTVAGSVFGGGLGEDTHMANGTVVVVSGEETTIEGNIYGGGELGNVTGGGTDVTLNGATVNDVFGAGYGSPVNTYALANMNSANVVGNTKVTVVSGKANNVYGGGENGSVNYNTANNYAPNGNYTSTVTILGGTIQQDPADKENTGNVYGGGSKGLTQNNTIVNVQGGVIENSVYGGALGTTGRVYVGGMRTVNMAGGHVYNSVYAGSRNADDARRLSNYTAFEINQPANVVNMSGGHVDYQVFAAGFFGHTYGSVYAFIGQNAINNAPNKQPTNGFNYNITNLSIDGNVWAGADYGNFDGTSFGAPTVEGNSNIYIDGLGYDTETHNTTGGSYMSINGSVFGSGTSCFAGKLERNVIVRKYGVLQENPDFDVNNVHTEKYNSTTRSLYSIQYATNLVIDDAHITFEGQGQISSLVNTEKYSVFKFDDMKVVNGASLVLKYPVDSVMAVGSYKCTDVYAPSPSYTEIGIDDLSTTDNKIRVNNGSVLYVRYTTLVEDDETHEVTEKTQYGTLTGYFHMMTDNINLTCAYARPKWGEDAQFDAGDEEYDNPDDGGFVSYHSLLNPFDAEGNEVGQPGGKQIAYENHTHTRNGEDFFRIWLYGDKYSFREKVINAQAKDADGYSVASVVVNLPARQNGVYYRIKQKDGFTTIDYGEDVMTINAGATDYDANNNTLEEGGWMKFNGDENNPAFLYGQNQSDMGTQLNYLDNSTFGLVAVPQGAMAGSGNKEFLINEAADEYLATDACKWTINDQTKEPSIEFLLTYTNRLSSNMTWDPITIIVEQYDANGTVLDEVTIELTVITSTDITQTFQAQTYAIMRGNGLPSATFSTKVVLPEYTLFVDEQGRPSTWTFKSAEFVVDEEAGDVGDENSSWCVGDGYIQNPAPYSDHKFSMSMAPGYNKDNTIGWDNHVDDSYDVKGGEANHEFGYTYGRSPIAFDFTLHYDGRASVDQKKRIGTVNITLTFTNYKNAPAYYPAGTTNPNTNKKQDVVIQVEVWRVGNGTNYYLDGVNGNNFFAGDRPNAAKKTLNGILKHSDYLPGDNIFIVNTVTADGNATLNWDGEDVGGVLIYRYPGGHTLSESTEPTEVFLGWSGYNPNNLGFAKELVNVEHAMVMHGITLDGSHEIVQTTSQSLYPVEGKYVEPTAPLVKVAAGAELSVYADSKMQHNYANADGGAIYNEGTVNALRGAELSHNAVKSGKNGGGIYQKEGATLQLSDIVTIDNNFIYTSGSKADQLGDKNNVYLETVSNVINVGTLNPNDNYIALDETSKIGVTKAEWGPNYYTEVVYSDGEFDDYLQNILDGVLVYDDEGLYDLVRLNISDNYLYFVGTWVTLQRVNPQDEEHPNNFDPSIISTDQELAWLISYVNGLNGATPHYDAEATLIADIDMNRSIWVPIGEDSPFTGIFNGNGHVVTGIRSPLNGTNMGMFGSTSGNAEISDFVASVKFENGVVSNMGSVVGTMNGGTLSNIEAAGIISGATTTQNIGGLVGKVESGTIHSSFAVNTLTGAESTVIGGLIGTNGGDLYNSYSNVTMSGATQMGGLAGINNGHIENCYAIVGENTFPAFAYDNTAGEITVCYADQPNGYMTVPSTSNATLSGTYGAVQPDIKHLEYMFYDNLIAANTNTYVGDEGVTDYANYHTPIWNGLLSALNQWVRTKNGTTSTYTLWNRPINNKVNGDLPVLAFPKDNSMATLNSDGKYLQYSTGLDNLLDAYTADAGIFVYGAVTGVAKVPANTVKVTINEDAVLLQATGAGNFTATVGVTFDNSCKKAVDHLGNTLKYDWHFMSSSLQDAAIGATYNEAQSPFGGPISITKLKDSYFPNGLDVTTPGTGVKWDLYTYYEPEYHWINLKRNGNSHWHQDNGKHIDYVSGQEGLDENVNETIFVPGKGYMMAISQDSYMNSTGVLNKGGEIVTLYNKEKLTPVYNKGWNLVGNPYQAYLDLSQIKDHGDFYIYDADQGVFAPVTAGQSSNPCIPSLLIHPHQGFFMHSNAQDGQGELFTFDYAWAKATKDDASYYRGSEDRINYPLVNIFAENEHGNRDLAVVEFNRPELGGATKVNCVRNTNFQVAASLEGQRYGLVFTPEGTERVPVHFTTEEDGTFTLTWNTHNGEFTSLLLVDNMTGTITDMLRADHYTFDATTDDYASRFYLTYTVTGVDEYGEGDGTFAFFDGSAWVVNGKGQLDVVDVQGRTLYSERLVNDKNRVSLNGVAAGVYLLRVSDGNDTMVQKIVVK